MSSFTRKCWCRKCNGYSLISFEKIPILHTVKVAFSHVCLKCKHKGIDKVDILEWDSFQNGTINNLPIL